MDNAITAARKMDTATLIHVSDSLDRDINGFVGEALTGALEMIIAARTVLCERACHE